MANPFESGRVLKPTLNASFPEDAEEEWGLVDFEDPEGRIVASVRITQTEQCYQLEVDHNPDDASEEMAVDVTTWEPAEAPDVR